LPPERDSDAILCARSAAGDRRAFGLLVARHERALRAFLGRMAGADLGDELAQEAFVKAWHSARRFRGEAKFSSWLGAIGWRCYVDHLRRTRGEQRKRDALALLSETDHPPAGDASLDLDRALARLAPVERAAIVLCDGHGWSHAEVAAMLDIPLGTLKSAAVRAKRKSRALLMGDAP
jgi:RNA polymerase sigma-70 factor (ECF subfamily)